jgi:hypothetical protein
MPWIMQGFLIRTTLLPQLLIIYINNKFEAIALPSLSLRQWTTWVGWKLAHPQAVYLQ